MNRPGDLSRLIAIMARLRDREHGCPWDVEQNFASIAPYTIEEAYEVADAIERNDLPALRDELGDLLFQVVFHARLAEEQGLFDIDAVVEGICEKLERRHPHVFAGAKIGSAAEQSRAWEEHKGRERAGRAQGLLDGVPLGLPALTRATKLGRRAARVGFDWPDVAGVMAKIDEEIAELRHEVSHGETARIESEMGDLLFSIANLCRHLEVDAEQALRQANRRFERRFRHIECRLQERGMAAAQASAELLDALWREAKAVEPDRP